MALRNDWWSTRGDTGEDPTGEPGPDKRRNPYPVPANGGGCDGKGGVESLISPDGLSLLSEPECVDPAEQARRQALQREANSSGQNNEPTKKEAAYPIGGGDPFDPSQPWGGGYPGMPKFGGDPWGFSEQWKQPTADDVLADPGYQFRLDQGTRALAQSAAGRGVLNTGGTLKDFIKYGSDYASNEYGNVFDRYNTGYNTRLNAYGQGWNANNQLAAQRFAPRQLEWTTNYAAQQRARELEFQKWIHNHLGAADAARYA